MRIASYSQFVDAVLNSDLGVNAAFQHLMCDLSLAEREVITSQKYGNTYRIYWHGSIIKGLKELSPRVLTASLFGSETVPVIWVTTNLYYAMHYSMEGVGYGTSVLYRGHLKSGLNIFNALSKNDWEYLRNCLFKSDRYKDLLQHWDWGWLKGESGGSFSRDQILQLTKAVGYHGVSNFELEDQLPSVGLFYGEDFQISYEYHLDPDLHKFIDPTGKYPVITFTPDQV
jgi:hypothetical protein